MPAHEREENPGTRDEDSAAPGPFAELVRQHQAAVRGFLLRLCRNYDLADDLAQEVFLIVHGKLKSFEGRGSFGAWLHRIAYNCFLQHQRGETRRREVMQQYGAAFAVEPDRYDDVTPEQIDLEQALARLAVVESAAITLCHSHGFSHAEAAAILKLPLGTLKSNVRRGMEKLRRIVADEVEEIDN